MGRWGGRQYRSIVLRITIDKIRTIYEHKYNAMNLRLRHFSPVRHDSGYIAEFWDSSGD